eukprot:CAMPEP_0115478056 /NCGR_PEP_ID=MMETSP0271-20121206/56001_1 /TAXON_ID=71861 /ORGANISM="Scrippsiella trochoidea, Strain CCMP3099" /LENGTH=762 /DNA_ID=CAMNT_0002905579 /DNA_START=111 /DNA_END=2396 /DNA_ORIENTATION=+
MRLQQDSSAEEVVRSGRPPAAMTQATAPVVTSHGGWQKGVVLGFASAAIGLLTTLSGIVIELASGSLADLRHGVCVARLPGDTLPIWEATVAGGWRPYDRMRCCGGSALVDHATEECRAMSIIKHSTRKRLAFPVLHVAPFGAPFEPVDALISLSSSEDVETSRKMKAQDDRSKEGSLRRVAVAEGAVSAKTAAAEHLRGNVARAASVRERVGVDAAAVRNHMSHLWGPDPAERWAEESTSLTGPWVSHQSSWAEDEVAEVAVNDGIAQTWTESAGSLAPVYEWVPWERALATHGGPSAAYVIYILGTCLLALCAALVTRCRPYARGSGIPEVKATVAGFALPSSFHVKTMAAKVVGLSLCVGAGLAVGKEGPMIHIGACWGAFLALPISRLARGSSPIEETELVCIGAAAGVAAAFGAPLAGVLFAVEELGTTLPNGLRYLTMLCAFGSAVVAALALKWMDLTRTQRLTLFEVDYKQAWAPWEALPFCFLGVCGGLLGGAFVLANEAVHRRRLRAEASGRSCWYLPAILDRAALWKGSLFGVDVRVVEVVLLALLTGLSNYPHMLTRMLQNDAIKALFSQCPAVEASAGAWGAASLRDPVGLCGVQDDAAALWDLTRLLLGAMLLRFLQSMATFGALTPSGLFVPSLFMGGCAGRALGALLKFAGLSGAQGALEPGIYAMVGAGAMLAGVSRMTVSLAVVLFELTGGLTYVVPFMLAVLIAKWTGDAITDGRSVYDVHAELKGFTKVELSDDVRILNATLA